MDFQMYEIMDFNPITLLIVVGTMLICPIYVMATYTLSGASIQKGLVIGTCFTCFGTIMTLVCFSNLPRKLGVPGNLIVPLAWATPSVILFIFKDWFLSEKLSQKWLLGLQIFRVIGLVFLVEMLGENLPGIFAYPAGVGDVIVGVAALIIILQSARKKEIHKNSLFFVAAIGILDFVSAFFFGFFSSLNPFQLFFPEVTNNVILFPTGMIPLFLVPYAIFFHFLSLLNYSKFEKDKNLN